MGVFKGNVAKYSREITKQYASSQDYLGAGESHLLIQMQGIPLQNWDAKPEPKTQRMSRAGITEVGQSEGRKVKYFFNPLEQLVYHLKKEDPNQLQMFHLGWYETCDILTKNKSLSKIHLSFSNVADRCFIQAATTSHGTRLQIP